LWQGPPLSLTSEEEISGGGGISYIFRPPDPHMLPACRKVAEIAAESGQTGVWYLQTSIAQHCWV